jgi:hypothetical protein
MNAPRKLAAILAADVAGYSRLTALAGTPDRERHLGGRCLEMEIDYAVQSTGDRDSVDGVRRKFCLGILLRGGSAAGAAGHRSADGVASMRLRRHKSVGSKWLSIVRLSEHVPEPVC